VTAVLEDVGELVDQDVDAAGLAPPLGQEAWNIPMRKTGDRRRSA
jgi:hypothetical protein